MANFQDPNDPYTKREMKYDASGGPAEFEKYREHIQRTMLKPYPEHGGFYGMGSLVEMGLRRSRHTGDFRTKSEFQNKEESFRQPLRGLDTLLEPGLTIRGTGGERKPRDRTGDGELAVFQTPSEAGRASTEQNLELIRSLGKKLTLPKQVLLRRQFESELESLNTPDALPDWSLRFCFKLFRVYTVPYPAYRHGIVRSDDQGSRQGSLGEGGGMSLAMQSQLAAQHGWESGRRSSRTDLFDDSPLNLNAPSTFDAVGVGLPMEHSPLPLLSPPDPSLMGGDSNRSLLLEQAAESSLPGGSSPFRRAGGSSPLGGQGGASFGSIR
ncbi:hypothetical protein T484DRAFT_1879875, partial [Baffinella frigidus]